MPVFSHLHCHTQFSLLDGAARITSMMKKAQADGMPAVALTDHGNMFGAFKFVAEANKYNVKPIVGCEFYLVNDRHKKSFSKEEKDNAFHQLLLAKDQDGYKNLAKLCSLGYMEGPLQQVAPHRQGTRAQVPPGPHCHHLLHRRRGAAGHPARRGGARPKRGSGGGSTCSGKTTTWNSSATAWANRKR
jgi:DNA polymerase III alpha subunit